MFALLKNDICPSCGSHHWMHGYHWKRGWDTKTQTIVGASGFFCKDCQVIKWDITNEEWIKTQPAYVDLFNI